MSDVLAIETSSTACSVALGRGDDVLSRHRLAPRQQIELVLPLVDELLAERGIRMAGLGGIAFGRGPGSFTGIRIALSVTQGLALAHGLPVLPISSLAALAQGAFRQTGHSRLLVAQDARMGEVYWATYEIVAGRARLIGTEQLSAPGAVRVPAGANWHGVGNAWESYDMPEVAARPLHKALAGDLVPAAVDVLTLAEQAQAEGLARTAREARPSYLRDRVARLPRSHHN
jgi:tRNA threonylcarbamoyladenosine biosynthesis protein TsaB